jgi:hypothetical protein
VDDARPPSACRGASAIAALVHQRCLNHAEREAAARCPNCRRYYCRECVTEHDGRVTCAECLAKVVAPAISERVRWVGWAALSILGMFVAWLVFYYLGAFLSRMPASFHGDA